ncbi:hypothetical protein ACLKA7_016924 [Drosophila subpalustris]
MRLRLRLALSVMICGDINCAESSLCSAAVRISNLNRIDFIQSPEEKRHKNCGKLAIYLKIQQFKSRVRGVGIIIN